MSRSRPEGPDWDEPLPVILFGLAVQASTQNQKYAGKEYPTLVLAV
jgi:hypothetical protein